MKKNKCTAILLAGGQGRRMGGGVPKQFLHILDKPVIYYPLKCFQESDIIDEVILVTSDERLSYCKEKIIRPFGFTKVGRIVAGGSERSDSVYEGLKACGDADYVFIHDGARPFVTGQILRDGYIDVKKYGASAAGVPSKDTIKIADADGMVDETPDRSKVWIVQTPQIFSYHLIRGAYERRQHFEKCQITDDAMVVERMEDHPVHLFMGSYRNIKITYAEDLEIAAAFVKEVVKKDMKKQ